ncbi:hypothetical protein D8674_004123 [Pyrus ussuriensis x Pyrus communis]|uniref:Uncharacterized protein n=1 Tax=Pyrus ussuriensis x Pyrus communis TaxID=2448454 RepID=A0A5N5FIZ2_9ROSA|nr:hypothetical protein D8674_004123 [Pyrus ussuriensis x Pyrus communis]
MPLGPHDMTQYVKFVHSICIAMHNNCPTAKWCSWKFCNYTLDDMNEELMKLMKEALKRGCKQWRYDVEQNGGPTE